MGAVGRDGVPKSQGELAARNLEVVLETIKMECDAGNGNRGGRRGGEGRRGMKGEDVDDVALH